jgi:hypothetical protein
LIHLENGRRTDPELSEHDDTSTTCDRAANMRLHQNRSGFDKWGMEHRVRVMEWQHRSSVALFFVVTGVVVIGVALAYLEFRKGTSGVNSLKLSREGLEISSPVIGLIILSISLGFFYLYLQNVYPVTEPRTTTQAGAVTETKK